jgi:hypothetical protein
MSWAQAVYRSVDEAGHVTYSSQPPKDAVEVETVPVAPGPSAEATQEARDQVREMEKRTDAQFESLMDRRRQDASARREAREAAERERAAREAADRQRRMDEAPVYFRPYYPLDWRWRYPPHPPVHPPRPPKPDHPVISPNLPYQDHINTPLRNW